jgi:uncharacterized small protein (DUF1192 family)
MTTRERIADFLQNLELEAKAHRAELASDVSATSKQLAQLEERLAALDAELLELAAERRKVE